MNFGLCKNSGGCDTPAACAQRAASACEFSETCVTPQGVVWHRHPGARRPELVTQAQVDAMDSTMDALDVTTRSVATHAAERAVTVQGGA